MNKLKNIQINPNFELKFFYCQTYTVLKTIGIIPFIHFLELFRLVRIRERFQYCKVTSLKLQKNLIKTFMD